MKGYLVRLEVEAYECRSDHEAVDHDPGLANSKVSAALHYMLGILVSCYIVIADQKVHQTQLPKL